MTERSIGPVLMNGVEVDPTHAAISVFDIGFQRGYGCFEAMRSYGGTPFRMYAHLERLENSARNLRIGLPDRSVLADWCLRSSKAGDGQLRVFVTGGLDAKNPGTDNTIVIFLEPLPDIPPSVRLDVIEAPWHADGRTSELTGAKTLSYGPNLAATIAARSRGFDDAALVGANDIVLEGPTFSLGWVRGGVMYTPSLESHILESITREATLEVAQRIGVPTETGRYDRSHLLSADEVFVMSTVREVLPVTAVGDTEFEPGPITAALRRGFGDLVAQETG